MSHLELRGKYWHLIWWDENGKKHGRSLKTRSKLEAKERQAEKDAQVVRRKLQLEDAAPEPIAFEALCNRYIAERCPEASRADAKSRLKQHVYPHIPKTRLSHLVQSTDIGTVLADMERRGKSDATRQRVRSLLRSIFYFAIKQAKVLRGTNPVLDVPDIASELPEPRWVPLEWIHPIIQHVAVQHRGLFATAAMTALRKGEVCGLLRVDVDVPNRRITVRRSYRRKTTKGKRRRVVPIPEALVPYLEAELGKPRSELLFPNSKGKMHTRNWPAHKLFRTALKAAGFIVGYDHVCRRKSCDWEKERRADKASSRCPKCGFALWVVPVPAPYTFKDFRSTFLTHLSAATGDLVAAQRIAGHSTMWLTERHYIGRDVARLAAAANRLAFVPQDQPQPAAEVTRLPEKRGA